MLSPRTISNRGSFQNPQNYGNANHYSVSSGMGRIGGGGMSFGSNLPVNPQK